MTWCGVIASRAFACPAKGGGPGVAISLLIGFPLALPLPFGGLDETGRSADCCLDYNLDIALGVRGAILPDLAILPNEYDS
jgi:hypothetical protein